MLFCSHLRLAMETAEPEEVLLKKSKLDLMVALFGKMGFDGSNIVSG